MSKEKTVEKKTVKAKKQNDNTRVMSLAGIKSEMSHVTWLTKDDLIKDTVVVIATCAIFALGFWAVDSGVLAALKEVLGITLAA